MKYCLTFVFFLSLTSFSANYFPELNPECGEAYSPPVEGVLVQKNSKKTALEEYPESIFLNILETKDYDERSRLLQNMKERNQLLDLDPQIAISFACQYDNSEVLKTLLDCKVSPHGQQPKGGHCPLQVAAKWGAQRCTKVLLNYNPRNVLDQITNSNVIDIALNNGHKELTVMLSRHFKQRNESIQNFMSAINDQDIDKLEADLIPTLKICSVSLEDRYPFKKGKATPLVQAARTGKIKTLRYLLSKVGFSVENLHNGGNALEAALLEKQTAAFQTIVAFISHPGSEADFSLDKPISQGDWTALHFAAYQGDLDTLRYLRRKEVSLNVRTSLSYCRGHIRYSLNFTALYLAAKYGKAKCVRELLSWNEIEKNLDIDAISPHGSTALHAASSQGYAEIVKQLLLAGAKRDIRDNYGKLPWEVYCPNHKKKRKVIKVFDHHLYRTGDFKPKPRPKIRNLRKKGSDKVPTVQGRPVTTAYLVPTQV